MKTNQSPAIGIGCALEGIGLLFKPGIRRHVIIPLIVNTILFVTLLIFSMHYFEILTTWVNNHIPSWLHWLSWLLWTLFFVTSLVVVSYTFTLFANLIAAPFNSFLSEAVEFHLTGNKPNSVSIWKIAPRAIMRQLEIILYYLPRALILLVLFFIPVIQIAAGICWFLFNSWMMCLQYSDYPMDNHQISFSDMRQHMGKNRLCSLGFGCAVLCLTLIPVVNFLVMPAAVAGATKLWVESQ